MDFLTTGILCIALLLVLMGLGVNIGLSFILSGFLSSAMLLSTDAAVSLLGEASYSSIARPTWAAIPLFLLMGAFCAGGGLARLAYLGAFALARSVPGSLMIATCLSCGIFGAISGSSTATTAMFGKMALPEMNRFGYSRALSVGCIASAGTFASMIPPSILLIIYALFTHQSVTKLFAAGILPGLLTVAVYILTIVLIVRRRPDLAPAGCPSEILGPDTSRVRAAFGMWPIFIIAFVVLGGIYGGLLTPTEAAAAGAVVSLILAVGLGSFSGTNAILKAMTESARVTAMLFLLVVGALYFSRVMAISGLPQDITRTFADADLPRFTILLAIMAVIFVLGMFMVPVGIYALTLPIAMPVLLELGYDPVWFGIIVLKLTEIGAITPPVGLNVFAIKAVAPREMKITLAEIYRGCSVFLIADLCVLAALVAFPGIALWLPSLL